MNRSDMKPPAPVSLALIMRAIAIAREDAQAKHGEAHIGKLKRNGDRVAVFVEEALELVQAVNDRRGDLRIAEELIDVLQVASSWLLAMANEDETIAAMLRERGRE